MATPCISPPKLVHHDGFSNVVQTRANATLVESRFTNFSARHVTNCDNAMNCRFAYATWCPVCEEQEKNKKIFYHNGRRRSKSEGMDIDRSDDYYTKTTNNETNHCQSSVNFTKGRQSLRKVGLQSSKRFNLDSNEYLSYSSHIENLTSNKHFPVHPSANRQIFSGAKKITKYMRKPCENHIEPNRVCFDSWTSSSDEWVYPQRENELMPLHERYYYEVEMLRNKLHKLKELPPDGKRTRQNCELECNITPLLSEVGSKRPRDISPSNYMTSTSRKLPAVPVPRCTSKTQTFCKPNTDRKSNILSSGSATSFSSDSDLTDSECDEEDLKDVHKVDYEEDEQAYLNCAKPAINPSYSPSHLVNSISINDNVSVVPELDQGKLHPGLRASLFSHVPPYIRFSTHDVKGPALPPPLQKLLKWKLSTITPVVVRRTVANSNFKLVRKSNEWCGTWGKHMKSLCFKTVREQQKINHFPGTFQIGRKDRLWKNLFRLMTKFGKKEFGFIPRTYVLPQDNKLLRSAWEKNCGKERWIVKPPASARGTGIKVIHKWTQIPKKCPLVVQKYISDPYLINGSKFDLRLYVLVTSINPLRVYIYDNGLVRFASVKYSNEMTSLADRYMHLTNYSINKQSSHYTQNEDANACQGHKWSLHALWSHLRQQGVAVTALWHTLVDLVIKTIISGESAISQLSHANLASRYCSYELFGVDVLLDEQLKPWLLEVNISPSLHSSSPLDLAVKGPMVQDLMNIAGYQIPSKLSTQVHSEMAENLGLNPGAPLCLDRRLYTTALSNEERLKHVNFQQTEVREDYMTEILRDLTPDDVRHLVQYEDELTQIGSFQKIFPTTDTHEYHQFFEAPRYYNMLFDAWEVKQSKDRSEGIKLLESLCQEQVHLDTTHLPPKRTKVSASQSGNDLKSLEPDQLEDISEHYAEAMPTAAPDKNNESKLKRDEKVLRTHQSELNTPEEAKYLLWLVEQDFKSVPSVWEGWTVTPACGTICRAMRSRGSKPGLVTKPYPRTSYVVRRTVRAAQQLS